MRYFFATLLLVFSTSAVTAAAARQCLSVDDAIAQAQSYSVYAFHRVLDEQQGEKASAWFNEQPPPSQATFDTVILFRLKDRSGVVAFGNDDVVCVVLRLNEEELYSFMRAVFGEAVYLTTCRPRE